MGEAVIAWGRARGVDPEAVLTDAFTVLMECVNDQFLLPAGSARSEAIEPSLAPGDRVGGYRIVSRIQTLADTEIYQARADDGETVAIKIARIQGGAVAATMLAREARTLAELGGESTPRLLDVDVHDDRRAYLALSWCEGTPVAAVAGELREGGGRDRRQLYELCADVLDAYDRLHRRGFLHGDIHPGNVLVGAAGEIWLVDFGLARPLNETDGEATPRQGGVAFFFEPEYAAASQAGTRPPALSRAAEQYALAALVYHLLTGVYTHDFSLERETMLRQIADESPLPFVHHGLPAQPAVEAVLARALAKRPEDRFERVADLAEALRQAAATLEDETETAPADPAAAAFVEAVTTRCGWDGELLASGPDRAPTASVNYGASGIAWLCYRQGLLADDTDRLALADVWLDRARAALDRPDGFYNAEIEITAETVGRCSPYHCPSGVHFLDAVLADTRGDRYARDNATRAFVAATAPQDEQLDLTLGRSGIVLAGALLAMQTQDEALIADCGVGDAARSALATTWERLDRYPAIGDAREVAYLGIAHGWAGFLYAALAWSIASGDAPPAGVERRLAELAHLGQPIGRGLRWPWRRTGKDGAYMPGWCNGSAGYVFLWTLAHRYSGDERWLRLAEKAAWNCWEDASRSGSLCCGLSGRAYALLNWYKTCGDSVWVRRARRLGESAATTLHEELQVSESAGYEHSLYKGEVGLASLLVDLEQPERALMPVFEVPV